MAGAKDAGSRCRAVKQIIQKNFIRLFCVFRILILFLFREGMGIQPVDQFLIHPQSPERVLGCMDMQVNQSRNDQPVAVIMTWDPAPFFRKRFKYSDASSVFAHNVTMLDGADCLLIFTIADLSSDRKSFHVVLSLL